MLPFGLLDALGLLADQLLGAVDLPTGQLGHRADLPCHEVAELRDLVADRSGEGVDKLDPPGRQVAMQFEGLLHIVEVPLHQLSQIHRGQWAGLDAG